MVSTPNNPADQTTHTPIRKSPLWTSEDRVTEISRESFLKEEAAFLFGSKDTTVTLYERHQVEEISAQLLVVLGTHRFDVGTNNNVKTNLISQTEKTPAYSYSFATPVKMKNDKRVEHDIFLKKSYFLYANIVN